MAGDHGISIGIAGEPADQLDLEIAVAAAGEQVGIGHLLEFELDADFGGIGGDMLGNRGGDVVGRQDHPLGEAVGIAGLGQQLLGLRKIERERLSFLAIQRAVRCVSGSAVGLQTK